MPRTLVNNLHQTTMFSLEKMLKMDRADIYYVFENLQYSISKWCGMDGVTWVEIEKMKIPLANKESKE